MTRSLSTIAMEIWASWPNMYFGAVPYVRAMSTLDDITDSYGMDSAASVVDYFLGNAQTWRGEKASAIKAELRAMVKAAR